MPGGRDTPAPRFIEKGAVSVTVNILAIGDVSGPSGLRIVERRLRAIQKFYGAAFTVVNGENAAVVGITPAQAELLLDAGADVITLGNHTWGKREIQDYLDDQPRILRPANFAPQAPGRGWGVFETGFGNVCVISLIGRSGMDSHADSPFFEADRILKKCGTNLVLVDMHAEMTSEKQALGHYLDGRVSAVWGTHTHVQTSDAGLLPRGTGFITDLGMTGPVVSILGVKPEQSVSRFLGNPPQRYDGASGGAKAEGAIFTLDTETGLCTSAEAFRILE